MKHRKKILIIILSILIIGFGLFNYYGPRIIIEIDNEIYKTLRNNNKSIPQPLDYSLNSEQIYITSKDNFKLTALIIRTDSIRQKGTIILVHGIRAYKEHYLPICKLLSDNGFNSVIVDLRAHGESEGKYCTFGYKETEDIKTLIDSLETKKNLCRNYGIWGQSLGGAVAMQALAIDKRLQIGIIESTFSDFRTIVHDYANKTIGFSVAFINNYLIWRAEKIGDFNSNLIKPSEFAKQITQPILMVHGKADKRIKYEYGLENFKNIATSEKELLLYPTANHLDIWEVGGKEYFDKVLSFLDKVIN